MLDYRRLPIEIESPEEYGYERIRNNLCESSVSDLNLGDLNVNPQDWLLCYGEHRGLRELRELIASQYPGIDPDDILITPGAAAALFMLHTALLGAGDRVVLQAPNYATNLETPRALGCKCVYWPLAFEQAYRPDFETLTPLLAPGARLLSVTTPHNPTGACLRPQELAHLVQASRDAGAYLLVDETYRDIAYVDLPPLAATLDTHVISISSLSKSFGLPGIRMGWVICRDRPLMEKLLAAKEQILICNSIVDERLALAALQQRQQLLGKLQNKAEQQLQVLSQWMAQQRWFEWVAPEGGVVAFPRFRTEVLPSLEQAFLEDFYACLLQRYHTAVGPGHWFDLSDRAFRLGYAWPTEAELSAGLEALDTAASAATAALL